MGYAHGYEADLMVAMGSSLRVNPAADMANVTATKPRPGKLIIVNLQKTPLDYNAYMNIHCKLDDFFEILMQKMNMEIPAFKKTVWCEVEIEESKSGKETLRVQGVTETGGPYDIFKSIAINDVRQSVKPLDESLMKEDTEFNIKLQF